MPKTESTPRKRAGRWRILSRRASEIFSRGRAPTADRHWFDHPEMQARIAEAEAERAAGLGKRFNNRDEALAYLDSLA